MKKKVVIKNCYRDSIKTINYAENYIFCNTYGEYLIEGLASGVKIPVLGIYIWKLLDSFILEIIF